MKKENLLLFILIASVIISPIITIQKKAQALGASDFNASNIIDDSVFYNTQTMTVQQIQNFLNSQVPVCDTSHVGFTGSSGTVYSPPWTCLKDYQENPTTHQNNMGIFNSDGSPTQVSGGQTAAQIIWNSAQQYGINPQVILVTLQKETGIVTDTWPASWQYRTAMGYACPDTGPNNTAACNSTYYGFYNQVNDAAWQFNQYLINPGNYNFQSGVSRYVQYSPDTTCGGTNIFINNNATAALYNYTPYQPNSAALSGLSDSSPGGTATCGSYGNRNFFWYFTNWFGSTTGPAFAWKIVSFVYANGTNVFSLNTPEQATLTVENTGRTTWSNSGANPVRLATWSPADSFTTLLGPGSNNNRFATLNEANVEPNQNGTFTFNITPTQTGTFVQAMNLVSENSGWASWPGFSPTIIVNDGYSWQLQNVIYQNGTGLMNPGVPQLITVIAKNTGTATWSKTNGPPIRLGTWPATRNSAVSYNWPSSTRAADMNEATVAPGQTAGFQFWVNVPASNFYYEKLNLVVEGKEWMPDQGLTLYLKGEQYSWQPIWSSISTGTTTIKAGQRFTITIKALNTGDSTWYNNQNFPIRVGTSGPRNRGSHLFNSSWINDTRPSGLIENQVAPGQEGTFSFSAQAPMSTGPITESFNLVAEGLLWFNSSDITFNLNIN